MTAYVLCLSSFSAGFEHFECRGYMYIYIYREREREREKEICYSEFPATAFIRHAIHFYKIQFS